MVQTFFKRSCTIDRLRQGPLAGHIDLLAARLATHGYSRVHSRIQLRLVGHFNRWLEQKHLTAEQLDESPLTGYRRSHHADPERKCRYSTNRVTPAIDFQIFFRPASAPNRCWSQVILIR